MEESINDIIRKIRTDLRRYMNGIAAAGMRDKGIHYRMNFGVEILRLKRIAAKYAPNKDLAQRLWNEDVRELKILATMLYPPHEFSTDTAELWVREIPYQEIREQWCMNLLQKLDTAGVLVERWISDADESVRATGYWLYARLCLAASPLSENIPGGALLEAACGDLENESIVLRQAALNVLRFYGRVSGDRAAEVMHKIGSFQHSLRPAGREIFDALRFEFEG